MLAFPSPAGITSPTKSRSRAPTRESTTLGSFTGEMQGTPSALTRTAVSLEYAALCHLGHCPLGMYVTPSAENLLVWDAVFFVHQGASKRSRSALQPGC